MIRACVVSLILGISALAFAAGSADSTLHLTHAWQVSLDAEGKVVSLRDTDELAPALREPLEHAIRGWTFEPGRLAGQPEPTETTLSLEVSFVPTAANGYAVRIDDARTGGRIQTDASRKAPPRMPRDVIKPGFAAMIVVKANYDASGAIVSVEPQPQLSVNTKPSLEKATITAVKKWAVVPERVGGHAVASSLMLPVCYLVTAGSRQPPDFACAFTPQGSASKIAEGGAYALEPAARLRSEVIGRAL